MKKDAAVPLPPEELCALIDRYYPALCAYARRRAENSAEDLAQSAFLKLIEFAEYRGMPPNPAAWLFRVIRNEAIDQARRLAHQRPLRLTTAVESEHDTEPLLNEELENALAELPEIDRELVEMRIWGGLSFAEIAEILEIAKTTLFRRYESILADLRRKLE